MSTIETVGECDRALHRLLMVTLRREKLTADRDSEIAAIQQRFSTPIAETRIKTTVLEQQIQAYYEEHRKELEIEGKKSIQLSAGLLGMRAPTNPGLIPLSEKWTWDKIEAKLKEVWKNKYFHKPKPPDPDKVRIKKELTPEQLRQCGMRLDTDEKFYLELNRLAAADAPALDPEQQASAA